MEKSLRYKTHTKEGFEPGSNDTVLFNKLGIKAVSEIEDAESIALQRVQEQCVNRFHANDILTAQDICILHKEWLGEIYEFAGTYRTVNMSKDGFLFAAAHLIPTLRNVINYKLISEKNGREAYFHAIQRGVMEDYIPMIELFEKMLNDDF